MDAIPVDHQAINYTSDGPVLAFGSSAAALAAARRTLEGSDVRIGACAPIAEARDRLNSQISMRTLWIELDRDWPGPIDELLAQVSYDVGCGRYSAVLSTTGALSDRVVARLGASPIAVIVDADEAERSSALVAAMTAGDQPLTLHDIASDQGAERLRQLSEEVSRIASTLARLSNATTTSAPRLEYPTDASVADVSLKTVRAVIRARRLRSSYFPADLFADPAWDMMLDLLQAEIAQLRVPVSSLCLAADVPATTALRWIKTMVANGLFIRRSDPHDGRRVFVELAPRTSDALRRYFGEIGATVVV